MAGRSACSVCLLLPPLSSSTAPRGPAHACAVLGACVATLAEGGKRAVPWADSKLTLLLREGGREEIGVA